jgi:transaldolase
MKFFLDTANIEQIKKYAPWGVVDGVTTNPSLIAKEGVEHESRIKEIAKIIDGPISAEVVATDVAGMVDEGRALAKWHKNVVVKLPTTEAGIQALTQLKKDGIKVNMTLVFSTSQAILVAKAGADLISPFVGRLDDISQDGMQLIAEIMDVWNQYDFASEILVASIRHPRHVIDAATMGAHVCTMPASVLDQMIKHPLTDIGLEKFLQDYKNSQKQ